MKTRFFMVLAAATGICCLPQHVVAQCQSGAYGLGFSEGIDAQVAYTDCENRGIHSIVVSDLQPPSLISAPSEETRARLNETARTISRLWRTDPRYSGWEINGGGGVSGWLFLLWEPETFQAELLWGSHPDSVLNVGGFSLSSSRDSLTLVLVRRDGATGRPVITATEIMPHALENPYNIDAWFRSDPDRGKRHHEEVESFLRGWGPTRELFEHADPSTGRGYSR